ncbi:MAG TPA: PHP domain-containing protein, partial [Vicinamibacterales bacterium]|nr:PHP domain-containing protein [Vicinamibacterales bacterium]
MGLVPASLPRARLDLHCHSSASFDGEVPPERLMQLALEAGLTHLAITDHDTIEAALRARDEAPSGLTVIVGQEARTTEGDMIALFVERPIPSGLTPAQTSALIREQGGLVGLPHPFDVRRPSVGLGTVHHNELAHLAGLVDYVEVYNGRARDPQANARAAEFALAYGLARAAVS